MEANILVINVGSTSYKYKLFDMKSESVLAHGSADLSSNETASIRHQTRKKREVTRAAKSVKLSDCIKESLCCLIDPDCGALDNLNRIDGIGFKVVGAKNVTDAVIINEHILKAMEEYIPLLPSHNPPYIKAIQTFQKIMPKTPLVGLFETAFHQRIPACAYIYPLPFEWYEKYGIRRYGYHGASFRYISEQVPLIVGRPASELRIVACHLGGSSSVCAIKFGNSVDTSMGMSNQAGIPMGTRSGDFDPFIIPFIMDKEGLSTEEIRKTLIQKAGLAGISGLSGDIRYLQKAAARGNYRAQLALDIYAYEVKKYIGAYAAAMGGLDILVFTGGIGENNVEMRRKIADGLAFFGVQLDRERNKDAQGEAIISSQGIGVTVLVVPTNEEIIVARETVNILSKFH